MSARPPVLDAGRGSLQLPRGLVPVVMMLRTEGTVPIDTKTAGAIAQLERAGITEGGALHPLAARMLDVVIGPNAMMSIEISSRTVTRLATIWSSAQGVVLGHSLEGEMFELLPIERHLVPFHLAQLTRLSARRAGPPPGSVTAPLEDVPTDPNHWSMKSVVGKLVAAGNDEAIVRQLAEAHRSHRWTSRITSLWSAGDGSASDQELVIMDAGDAGYWQITQVRDEMCFTVRTSDEILDMLALISLHH